MTATLDVEAAGPSLTPHAPLKSAVVLVNPASGSVGPRAPGEVETLVAGYGLDHEVVVLEPGRIPEQIDAAFAAKPDLIAVLAGDGTAGSVANRATRNGPLIAPLPGGTMNMLPKALYGTADWKLALNRALSEGAPTPVSGGCVDGHAFYCAAILGAPALWAPAREALRGGELREAWGHARRAWRRAFSGHIRFSLDGEHRIKAEALVLISPMISRALDEPMGLEAAAMNPAHAADAFRLAAHALFDDWRADPAVMTRPTKKASVWARSRIPAVIDGEPMLLPREAEVRFMAKAFQALAPVEDPADVDVSL